MTLAHSLRSLRRTPFFAVAAVITLALGIGSVAAAGSIAYGILLDPLPYGRADRLVSIGLDLRATGLRHVPQSPGVYLTYKRLARGIRDLGFYRTGNGNLSTTDGTADPLRVTATWVTASLIPTLRVNPILGRSFTEEEDRNAGQSYAVISEWLWQTYFAGSGDVIGKTVIVNSIPRRIVGVMPGTFMFPTAETKVWLPARLDRDATAMGDFSYQGVARLEDGATAETVQRHLAGVLPRIADYFPDMESGVTTASWLEQAKPAPVVVPLRDEVTHGVADSLGMVAAAAALVLFVALANVANLMLIRSDARRQELAVREALGASRWRIATHFLGESLLLSAVAGGAAIFGAWAAVRALVAFGPADLPRLAELQAGLPAGVIVLAASLLAAILCAVVPTLRTGAASRSITLRDGGRGETAGRGRQRLRSTMAALQMAVALVVLAGSMLLLRTFRRLHEERPGFDGTNVTTLWTQLPFARYGDSASVAFYGRLAESAARLPGVVAVGLTTHVPLGDGDGRQLSFRREDGGVLPLPIVAIDSGYFGAMKIGLLAGSTFQRLTVQRDGEIVLSRRAAAVLFGGASPAEAIGRRVTLAPAGPTYFVIGVVADVRDRDLGTPASPTVYMPQSVPIDLRTEPAARRTMALVVRTAGATTPVDASIRRIVRGLDPAIPVFDVEPMNGIVRASTARLSFMLSVMGAAAIITLLLGAIGLYGVVAYTVALRTRELGIRIALGADPDRLARSVVRRGLTVVAAGLAGGFLLYALATPFLRGFLYGVTTADPVTLASATGMLIATACLASWIPARRAARVDPNVALRAE